MRVPLPARRPPALLEQLLGRRRARTLRRRLGLLALGAGVTLLKPRMRWGPLAMTAVAALTFVVALAVVRA
jgi:hypothetical protein